jgi:hypothetical protein
MTSAQIQQALACEHDAAVLDPCAAFKATENTKCAGQFPADASPDVAHCRGYGVTDNATFLKQYFSDFCGSDDGGDAAME